MVASLATDVANQVAEIDALKTDVTAVQDAQAATDDMIAILNTMVSDFSLMIAAQVRLNRKRLSVRL